MGYLKIENLYRNQLILAFRECFAMEKVHGTSAHIGYITTQGGDHSTGRVTFFSGGESYEKFKNLFDEKDLAERFGTLGHDNVIVYGEAYGGKQQGMSATYGQSLCFIVFDIKIGEVWLSVPDMHQVATGLGFEVVPYEKISTDLAELDRVRDMPSEVAARRGCGNDKKREGVVLRPLIEMTTNDGRRVITKHKNEAFSERATPQKVADLSQLEVLAAANEIANEWVTEMRLAHIMDKLDPKATSMADTPRIIKAMIADIYLEAKGEIVESKEASGAIGKRAAKLYKEHVTRIPNE